MRRRFFYTSLFVLFFTVLAVSFTQTYFFQSERMRLIDQQIEAIASSLLSTNLADGELEEMGDLIADALGDDRTTTLVTLFNDKDEIVYQNDNSETVFGDELPDREVERMSIEHHDHTIRLLNLKLARSKQLLQIGILLDKGKIHWHTLSRRVYVFLALILILMVIAAAIQSTLLLKPLRSVANYLRYFSESVGIPGKSFAIPAHLITLMGKRKTKDEFGELITSVTELTEKIYGRFQMNQASAAQMAHELKTPLTIIRNCLESIQLQQNSPEKAQIAQNLIAEATEETDHLNRVINNFLDWSRIEYTHPNSEEVHAIRLHEVIEDWVQKLNRLNSDRIEVVKNLETTVFGKPDLVQQLVRNLLENALKYSPSNEKVQVELGQAVFKISDRGTGIPESVIKRLGQPFNSGPSSSGNQRGTGLGLTWVVTICKLYGWTFSALPRSGGGSEISVSFGSV